MPVLVMHGEHAPRPSRTIATILPDLVPGARLATVAGAGHMGPLTHAAVVNALIVAHAGLRGAEATPPAAIVPQREATRGLLARFFAASWALAGSRS
jgi:hypothetical protein